MKKTPKGINRGQNLIDNQSLHITVTVWKWELKKIVTQKVQFLPVFDLKQAFFGMKEFFYPNEIDTIGKSMNFYIK